MRREDASIREKAIAGRKLNRAARWGGGHVAISGAMNGGSYAVKGGDNGVACCGLSR